MTTRILIVDPDIAFTVPIKQALEHDGPFLINLVIASQVPHTRAVAGAGDRA